MKCKHCKTPLERMIHPTDVDTRNHLSCYYCPKCSAEYRMELVEVA